MMVRLFRTCIFYYKAYKITAEMDRWLVHSTGSWGYSMYSDTQSARSTNIKQCPVADETTGARMSRSKVGMRREYPASIWFRAQATDYSPYLIIPKR